jgi:ribosomal protein L19E
LFFKSNVIELIAEGEIVVHDARGASQQTAKVRVYW